MAKSHRRRYEAMLRRLREARKEAGMTQVQVAGRLARYRSYVSKIELGERRLDAIELADFAKLYKKPMNYFVD